MSLRHLGHMLITRDQPLTSVMQWIWSMKLGWVGTLMRFTMGTCMNVGRFGQNCSDVLVFLASLRLFFFFSKFMYVICSLIWWLQISGCRVQRKLLLWEKLQKMGLKGVANCRKLQVFFMFLLFCFWSCSVFDLVQRKENRGMFVCRTYEWKVDRERWSRELIS